MVPLASLVLGLDENGQCQVGWAGANALDFDAPAKAGDCMPTEAGTWVIKGGFTLRP
ncbi:hypothetical protein EDD91_6822 [Streptomyces sp. KS 21]|nr:hypothetical protein EDD91_6822 [Streptomyces sp. KS 21]